MLLVFLVNEITDLMRRERERERRVKLSAEEDTEVLEVL